jgi:hypothetical protein
MLDSPCRPSSTILIFSSDVNLRRVFLLIFRLSLFLLFHAVLLWFVFYTIHSLAMTAICPNLPDGKHTEVSAVIDMSKYE